MVRLQRLMVACHLIFFLQVSPSLSRRCAKESLLKTACATLLLEGSTCNASLGLNSAGEGIVQSDICCNETACCVGWSDFDGRVVRSLGYECYSNMEIVEEDVCDLSSRSQWKAFQFLIFGNITLCIAKLHFEGDDFARLDIDTSFNVSRHNEIQTAPLSTEAAHTTPVSDTEENVPPSSASSMAERVATSEDITRYNTENSTNILHSTTTENSTNIPYSTTTENSADFSHSKNTKIYILVATFPSLVAILIILVIVGLLVINKRSQYYKKRQLQRKIYYVKELDIGKDPIDFSEKPSFKISRESVCTLIFPMEKYCSYAISNNMERNKDNASISSDAWSVQECYCKVEKEDS